MTTATLTMQQKITSFIETVNAFIGLNEVVLQERKKPQNDCVIDFSFCVKSDAFETDAIMFIPKANVLAFMEKAASEIFGSSLNTNNYKSSFWVIPA